MFGHSVLIRDDIFKNKPSNEWLDDKCRNARVDYHSARNLFGWNPTNTNRRLYIEARNYYNKVKRTAQFKAMQRKGLELCNIGKREPRKFWCAIKTNTVMINHFKNTIGSNPPELCHEVL